MADFKLLADHDHDEPVVLPQVSRTGITADLLGVLPVTRRRSRRRVVYQLIMIRIVSDSGSESKVDDDDE